MSSTFAAATAIILALSLSGCISESADIGRPPPVVLETPQLALDPLTRPPRDAAARAKVRQALAEIGNGDIQSVRVRIYPRSARDGEGLRRMLVGIGVDPARLTMEPGRWPANRLVLTRAVAETAPCATAISPVDPDDPLPSLMSLAHCTQTNNLANMLVDPGDLVTPPRLSAEDGQFLVDGVESWRKNRSQGLPSQDGSASGGGGGGGSPTTASAGAATLPATLAPTTAGPVAPAAPVASVGQ
jgi:type IV pilus biogenesis protein CpaD/CtpE